MKMLSIIFLLLSLLVDFGFGKPYIRNQMKNQKTFPETVFEFDTTIDLFGSTDFEKLNVSVYSELPSFITSHPVKGGLVNDYVDISCSYQVVLVDHYAFVSDCNGFSILNVLNKNEINLVSHYATPACTDIEVIGDVAYIATQASGFDVVDISDMKRPIKITSIVVPGTTNGIKVQDDYVFVTSWGQGLYVYDKSTFAQVGHLDNGVSCSPNRLVIQDKYVYMSCLGGKGVDIVSIEIPTSPSLTHHITLDQYAYDVALKDLFLFVSSEDGYIHVYDVRDQASPKALPSIEAQSVFGLYISGDYLYYGEFESENNYIYLVIQDISTPSSPELFGKFCDKCLGSIVYGVHVSGSYAYFSIPAVNGGFRVIGISGGVSFTSKAKNTDQCHHVQITMKAVDQNSEECEDSFFVDVDGTCSGKGSCGDDHSCVCKTTRLSGSYCQHCATGYFSYEDGCNVTSCGGIFTNSSTKSPNNICNGHGKCVAYDHCQCEGIYSGQFCMGRTKPPPPRKREPKNVVVGVGVAAAVTVTVIGTGATSTVAVTCCGCACICHTPVFILLITLLIAFCAEIGCCACCAGGGFVGGGAMIVNGVVKNWPKKIKPPVDGEVDPLIDRLPTVLVMDNEEKGIGSIYKLIDISSVKINRWLVFRGRFKFDEVQGREVRDGKGMEYFLPNRKHLKKSFWTKRERDLKKKGRDSKNYRDIVKLQFEGLFSNDERHGRGTEYFHNRKRKLDGFWDHGKLKRVEKEYVPLKTLDLVEQFQYHEVLCKDRERHLLGKGGEGEVFKVVYEGEPAAAKFLPEPPSSALMWDDMKHKLMRSMGIWTKIMNHPNILNLKAWSGILTADGRDISRLSGYRLGYVMDVAVCDMSELIRNKKLVNDWEEKIRIMYEITDACRHMSSHSVMHRDLKLQNILYSFEGRPLICDFDCCAFDESDWKTYIYQTEMNGTYCYLAPEVYRADEEDRSYNKFCDVFSFGMIWYCFIFDLLYPYEGIDACVVCDQEFQWGGENKGTSVAAHVANCGVRPPLDRDFDDDNGKHRWMLDVIMRCWEADPEKRPTFEDILEEFRNHHYGKNMKKMFEEEEEEEELEGEGSDEEDLTIHEKTPLLNNEVGASIN